MTSNLIDSTLTLARMDAQAVRILMEAGALPNDGRVELIDGALVEMSPSNDPHGAMMSELIFARKASSRVILASLPTRRSILLTI